MQSDTNQLLTCQNQDTGSYIHLLRL